VTANEGPGATAIPEALGTYLDHLSRLAAGGALLFGGAFVVGWLYLAGVFSIYGIPVGLIDPQPVPTALNAFSVTVGVYLVLTNWRGFGVLITTYQEFLARHRTRNVLAALVVVALLSWRFYEVKSWTFLVILVSVVAAFAYFGVQASAKPTIRTFAVLVPFAGLLSYGLGIAAGEEHQANPALSTPVRVQTTTALPGLVPASSQDGLREYEDLYVVYADANNLIVASRSAGGTYWMLPRNAVTSLTLSRP
jgi:hypothetical protein